MRRGRGHRNPLWWVRSARILDFLPEGRPLDPHPEHRSRPFIQALEESRLKLISTGARYGATFTIGEKISFKPIDERIIGKIYVIKYEDLTGVAQESLPEVVRDFVKENEKLFVTFLNISEPITLKLHSLELIPGVGKKTLRHILDERKVKPFESFEDFEKRTGFKNIVDALVERIIREIKGEEKYYLFVEPEGRGVFLNYLGAVRRRVRMDEGGAGETGGQT
ncbi:RNA-binding protein [Ignicoccus pacificus DSM 13166]|uniref:RNA-binding protein n=1 Tax=Ignicoccus pacificus DSM 13166 TaxID=940294 RepID=A0A977PKZ7_9CREN|nr:RNA-binding protein [Ignicoccus pacificus DSM 13166]